MAVTLEEVRKALDCEDIIEFSGKDIFFWDESKSIYGGSSLKYPIKLSGSVKVITEIKATGKDFSFFVINLLGKLWLKKINTVYLVEDPDIKTVLPENEFNDFGWKEVALSAPNIGTWTIHIEFSGICMAVPTNGGFWVDHFKVITQYYGEDYVNIVFKT